MDFETLKSSLRERGLTVRDFIPPSELQARGFLFAIDAFAHSKIDDILLVNHGPPSEDYLAYPDLLSVVFHAALDEHGLGCTWITSDMLGVIHRAKIEIVFWNESAEIDPEVFDNLKCLESSDENRKNTDTVD